MKIFITILLIVSFFNACSSKNKNEKYYQTIFCEKINAVMEYRLKDKTRIDCLSNEYAIEVDWAKKWAEAIGQSLYYSEMTNKKPAIVLIVDSNDDRFVNRAKLLANKYNIKIFILKK